jgi:AraC family transcriptional regulator
MRAVAVDAGTKTRSSASVGTFDVSDVEFGPGAKLGWHSHPRACVAVLVTGVVRKRFVRQVADAGEGTLVTMPAHEPHEDLFGRDGARIVVVENDVLDSVGWFRDWTAVQVALRVARELELDDSFTPLALEGLSLELLALAGRGPSGPPVSAWLREAHDALCECFREPPTTAEIAEQVGVHPAHLAREFRLHYGDSLGGFVRRLRLEWAAGRLITADTSLACLAFEAGFADQSHFTRAFKRRFGITPGRYRHLHR